ncbi:MAG: molybdenum cofactor guanylyltransferase [Candidatus Binataceae bacterium]|nr:molybdenum cofactor guanylyltransferase [Candidatus Binataceae bacterium]
MNGPSAVILAGGRSSRMGLPKAVLPFGASTILERLIETLAGAFTEIIVVAAPLSDEPFSIDRTLETRDGVIVERDDTAFEGPVGALRRGLARACGEVVFACSCDLPLLRRELATAICTMAEGHEAAMPSVAGMLQPLCAAYRRDSAMTALAAMEAAGERRLTTVADRIEVRAIEEAELRVIDPDLRSLLNVNTFEDYVRALRLTRAG